MQARCESSLLQIRWRARPAGWTRYAGTVTIATESGGAMSTTETARLLRAVNNKLRVCGKLVAAADCLMMIGRAIGMPHPAVIDDYSSNRLLTLENGRALTSVLGWDVKLVREWVDQELYRISPIAAVCRISTRPFAWDAGSIAAAAGQGRGRSSLRWPLLPGRGFFGGITVPVHLPQGRTGSVSWYSRSAAVDMVGVLDAHSDALRLAALRFMDLVYTLRIEADAGADPRLPVSERELECLTWAALGRTDVEIGAVLHRSPTTVRFHMDNAIRKLGARNRTQAVAVAIQRGLIEPLDPAVFTPAG
jgi:DNA-binding CsgD family transcriptional regulator